MTYKYFILRASLLFVISSNVFASQPTQDRTKEDLEAKSKFLNTHFYKDGSGMHFLPDFMQMIRGLPDLGGGVNGALKRFGINTENGKPVGFFTVKDNGIDVGAGSCVVCHSGQAAGQFVVGLGNKLFDPYQLGKEALPYERDWANFTNTWMRKSDHYKHVEKGALDFTALLANKDIGNLTQGLIPVGVVRSWFYTVQGKSFPKNMSRSAVKVPALWGYGEKRKVGQFCDGMGDGAIPGWGALVELAAGQSSETVRNYMDRIEETEQSFEKFLPPKYPFAIDVSQAMRGKDVFIQSCAKCHGTYETDDKGLPLFEPPKWIKWEVVKTDPDRLDGNTDEFKFLASINPLSDLILANRMENNVPFSRGYFAPRLVGIWARFPYLHNASVPNIKSLLMPPSLRPKAFSLEDAGEKNRFDSFNLGLNTAAEGSAELQELIDQGKRGQRNVYWTERVGQSNQGHDFYTGLPESSKLELIEYLKTL